MIGKRLLHYEITAKLGEGGMGEVYRARDAKLDRDVALKVLPEVFTSNPERLTRFEREAKVLASLNHPNIAHIYGLEEGGGTKALVLELVEGPTLADRIDQSPIPLAEAVDIARQIAEALEAAHEQGIIHRDLKPANVKVRPDGAVKVLDFGLAKAVEPEPEGELGLTQAPTLISPATQLGVIMGTAAYMAPEQAEGKAVDARADLFAFGCVLYEMVTGGLAFAGDSLADTLSRVLHDEPRPAGEIVPTLPPRLAWVLEKCLAKNPADRYQGAGDLVVDLRGALSAPKADPAVAAPVGSRPFSWRWPVLAAAAAAALLIGGLLLGRGLKPKSEAPTRQFEILTMDLHSLSPGGGRLIGISRDGMQVAYVDGGQIFVRDLSRSEAQPLAGSGLGVAPFFSPDGDWLVYTSVSAREARKVWLESGESFEICSVAAVFGGAWGEDDTIVLSDGSSLWKVPAGGASCHPLGEDQRDLAHAYRAPQFLPGGQELLVELFEGGGAGGPKASVAIVSASTGELLDVVVRDAGSPLYIETGHLLFLRGRTMFAQRFDPRSRTTMGEPTPVVDDVGFAYLAHLDVSADGTLVYMPARAMADLELVWVDRDGREDRLPLQPASYLSPRLSPSGDWLAVALARSGQVDLAIVDPARATVEPFAQNSFWPAWTPDGKKLAFVSLRELPASLWWQDLEGGAAAERIAAPPEFGYFVLSASVDPLVFTFYELRGRTARDILVMRPGEDPITLVATPDEDYAPRLSADARFLAYVTDSSGREEVYVRTCPPCRPDLQLTERVWRVSLNGGAAPVWSRDGNEIFYLEGRNMMAARVRTEPGFTSEPPELLFESTHLPGPFGNPNYDVGPDGRFIMIKGAGSGASRHGINVVVNWFEELNARVASIR